MAMKQSILDILGGDIRDSSRPVWLTSAYEEVNDKSIQRKLHLIPGENWKLPYSGWLLKREIKTAPG
jgi:hypothetical protein